MTSGIPMSPSIEREIEELDGLMNELEAGSHKTMRKNANYQSYQKRMNRQDK